MDQVPPEILNFIFQYLPIKEQRNLRSTNTSLYELFTDEHFLKQIPPEILEIITDYLPSKDLANLRATNLYARNSIPKYEVYVRNDFETKRKIRARIDRLKQFNPLWTLIDMFPTWNWDWDEVSANINTYWDTEGLLRPKFWSYWGLSRNPNITLDIILSDPDGNWDWEGITTNTSITNLDRLNHKNLPWSNGADTFLWYDYQLSKQSQSEAEKIFLRVLDYFVDEGLGNIIPINEFGVNILLSPHLMYLIDKYTQRDTNGNVVPFNYKGRQITFDWVPLSADKDISRNKYLTWDFIQRHMDHIDFDYGMLSANKNITLDIMINNPQLEWKLERNPNLTVDYILANPDLGWENVANVLSANPLGTL